MKRITSSVRLALALLLLLAGCQPMQVQDRVVTATLLTDGTGVLHNGRPAASGQPFGQGDWVRTGFAGGALVLFSDGTRVEIAEADQPVYLRWAGNKLEIRMDDGVISAVEGAVIDLIEMIGALAGVFNDSEFITVEDRTRSFRHLLLSGRAQMIFPRPGLPIRPGEYALVTPDGQVTVRPIPEQLLRELRQRLARWDFARADGIRVPDVVGLRLYEARSAIERAGLSVGRIDGPALNRSTVVRQSPREGATVPRQTPVDVTVQTLTTSPFPGRIVIPLPGSRTDRPEPNPAGDDPRYRVPGRGPLNY